MQHLFAWEEDVVVEKYEGVKMLVDPHNHTRWKHHWRWHNRGCVWDKLASEWTGDVDGIKKEAKGARARWT